ncbi:MAG: aconitate hydratase AcnA [Bauldia sp.]|nr:aconitate hydratase AcnA [Bauldia sp.]
MEWATRRRQLARIVNGCRRASGRFPFIWLPLIEFPISPASRPGRETAQSRRPNRRGAPVTARSVDSFSCRRTLAVDGKSYDYFSLVEAEKNGLKGLSQLPFSLKVLAENLLRHEDGRSVKADDIRAIVAWLGTRTSEREIAFRPGRVLMQDFTGVPAVVDLAAMRDAMAALGGDPQRINPLVPVDLVIDHSVIVDDFGNPRAFERNVEREYERNGERYRFLRWGQSAFANFRVVPPGTGICHQVNLEYLSQTVWTETEDDGTVVAYPDTLVGTDSHTTMVNGLAVLGWGVGGIEAEAAMLGQPVSMLIPEVVGFHLTGRLREGITATDLVLTVTQLLRQHGVVGRFVEFYGPGLDHLALEDRATIGNMAPEYGATCGLFPIDEETLRFLQHTGRPAAQVALVEAYARAQGMFREPGEHPEAAFTSTLSLDLDTVEPSIAGPKRPQDRVPLGTAKAGFAKALTEDFKHGGEHGRYEVPGHAFDLGHGDVVIAAITSCTNTSNPQVMIAAGLLARKARALGLKTKPWVKTSLAPGSQVVGEYLANSGLQDDLDALGFNLVGFGCTTCIGNSGPLPEAVSETIEARELVAVSVLSGNRNFEGRINPDVRANYLASPPLVVAYALAGSMLVDLTTEPLGISESGEMIYLRDVWPSTEEVTAFVRANVTEELFRTRYADVFKGDHLWQEIPVEHSETFHWPLASTYVRNPPYFEGMKREPEPVHDIEGARILGLFLDSITTDHISPAGSIRQESPAGVYLVEHQVRPADFNQYGTRRGNHEVMMRGTFANIRIKNQMVPGVEGGVTVHYPSGERMPIYDAAMLYRAEAVPLVVFAGREYGTGSSRDWAAKGTRLLGVRAVIAQSFERIHRSNLVGMGVLPLVFADGQSWQHHGITGEETVTIRGIAGDLRPRQEMIAIITAPDGTERTIPLLCRIDTADELDYFRNGGILPYVLRRLVAA